MNNTNKLYDRPWKQAKTKMRMKGIITASGAYSAAIVPIIEKEAKQSMNNNNTLY